MCSVKLTCHTVGCSAQSGRRSNRRNACEPKAWVFILFGFVFGYCQFFDRLLASTLEGAHMRYQHLHLLDFASTGNNLNDETQFLDAETKRKKEEKKQEIEPVVDE